MALLAEAAKSIYGAYRLARLDPSGLQFFDTTVTAAWRSFFAAVIIAPFYFMLLTMSPAPVATDPGRFWIVHLIGYVIAWTAFPVIMAVLTEALGRGEKFVTYLVVYNWASVVQNAVFIPVNMLVVTAVVPGEAGDLLSLVTLGLILGYFWYIAKTVLAITGLAAVAIVGLDLTLGVIISLVTDYLK